jgi:transcriptional regulator GlxA family with amidase domain
VDVSISRGVLALEAIAVAALSLLCAEAQSGRERLGPMHPSVVRACHFIEKNLSRQMELSSISHAAGLSLNHFSRLFDRQLGYTPIEYVWHLRIQKAASMLRSTGLSVGEISTQTGFQNPFHFSRRFKAAFGSSPRAYRTRAWNKSPSN